MYIVEKELIDGTKVIEFIKDEGATRSFIVVILKDKDDPYYFSSYDEKSGKIIEGTLSSPEGIISLILWANDKDKSFPIEGLTFINLGDYFKVIKELKNLSSEAVKRIRNYYE